jgi:hypothetical protein
MEQLSYNVYMRKMELKYGHVGRSRKVHQVRTLAEQIHFDMPREILSDERIKSICREIQRGQFHIAVCIYEQLLGDDVIPDNVIQIHRSHLAALLAITDKKALETYRAVQQFNLAQRAKSQNDMEYIQKIAGGKRPQFFERFRAENLAPIDVVASRVTSGQKK